MNSRLTIQTFLRNVSNSTVEAVVVVLVGGLPLILPFFWSFFHQVSSVRKTFDGDDDDNDGDID